MTIIKKCENCSELSVSFSMQLYAAWANPDCDSQCHGVAWEVSLVILLFCMPDCASTVEVSEGIWMFLEVSGCFLDVGGCFLKFIDVFGGSWTFLEDLECFFMFLCFAHFEALGY